MRRITRTAICLITLAGLVVTVPLAPPTSATFPGRNGVIVLVRSHGGCQDLYTVVRDGTSLTKRTACPQVLADPTVSPDGTTAAASYSSGAHPPHLVTLPLRGGTLTALDTGSVQRAGDPSYNRTGSLLAFGGGGTDPSITRDIYTVPAAGGSPTRLTTTTGSDGNDEPEFSPVADRIAWAHRTGGVDGTYDIWTMAVDQQGHNPTGLTDLTNGQGSSRWPSWSPDGNRLAFASDRAGGTFQIYVMDTDGTDPVQVTTGTADHIQPSWSPDGTAIVFTQGCDADDCAAADPRAEQRNGNLLAVDVADPAHPGTPVAVLTTGAPEYDAQWATACSSAACPTAVTHRRRAVLSSLHLLVAKGRVKVPDGYDACRRHVPLRLQYENNLRRGPMWKPRAAWLTEDRGRTTKRGRYRLHLPTQLTGWYRVRVPAVTRNGTMCAATASTTKVNNTIRDPRGESHGPPDIRWAWVTYKHGVITHTIRAVHPFTTGQAGTPCIIFSGLFNRDNGPNGSIGCFGDLVQGHQRKPITTRRPDARTISYSIRARQINGTWQGYIWVAYSRGHSDCDIYDLAPNDYRLCGDSRAFPADSAVFYKHEPS